MSEPPLENWGMGGYFQMNKFDEINYNEKTFNSKEMELNNKVGVKRR